MAKTRPAGGGPDRRRRPGDLPEVVLMTDPDRERVRQRLNEALDAFIDLTMDYARLMMAKERAERKQAQAEQALISANSMAASLLAHLEADHEDAREATRLLNLALHLRVHGENAPGGTETWRQFDRECEHYLRWGGRLPNPDPADRLHAGLGLPCGVEGGQPCTIDVP